MYIRNVQSLIQNDIHYMIIGCIQISGMQMHINIYKAHESHKISYLTYQNDLHAEQEWGNLDTAYKTVKKIMTTSR